MSKNIIKVDRYVHLRADGTKVIYSKGQEVLEADLKSISPRFIQDENGNTTPMNDWQKRFQENFPEVLESSDKTTPVVVKATAK